LGSSALSDQPEEPAASGCNSADGPLSGLVQSWWPAPLLKLARMLYCVCLGTPRNTERGFSLPAQRAPSPVPADRPCKVVLRRLGIDASFLGPLPQRRYSRLAGRAGERGGFCRYWRASLRSLSLLGLVSRGSAQHGGICFSLFLLLRGWFRGGAFGATSAPAVEGQRSLFPPIFFFFSFRGRFLVAVAL
jgi:hypothetical protein